MIDISKVVTPGEFMLQSAAVRGDASAAIGRGMAIGAQQKENQQRMDLLKQQMAIKQKAMNDFASWQNTIAGIKDPVERMRAFGTVPVTALADNDVAQAFSSVLNQTYNEYRIQQSSAEASGRAEQIRWQQKLRDYGVPDASIKAGPGDPLYEKGAKLARESEAIEAAGSLGYTPDQFSKFGNLPTLADGRLNKQAFMGFISASSPLARAKRMGEFGENLDIRNELKSKLESLTPNTPEWIDTKRQFDLAEKKIAGGRSQTRMTFNPQTGETTFEQGDLGDATAATQTRMQQTITTHRILGQEMTELENNLRAEDLGVHGWFGEKWDKWAPQLGLASPNYARTKNRAQLRATIQAALRVASPDSRYTENDYKRIAAILPSIGFEANVEDAKVNLRTFRELLAKRSIWDLQAISPEGRTPWTQLTRDEIKAAYSMGIGPDGVERQLRTKEDADALERDARDFLNRPVIK